MRKYAESHNRATRSYYHRKKNDKEFLAKRKASWVKYHSKPEVISATKARNKKVREERYALVSKIKMELGCIDCGYNSHPAALDFDHRDATTKSFQIGNNLLGNLDLLLQEISKCDVRCANCHRIKSFLNRDGVWKELNEKKRTAVLM